MTHTNQNQILEVFSTLDQQQANQVLAYAQQLLQTRVYPTPYQKFKHEAMKQIRQALQKERTARKA